MALTPTEEYYTAQRVQGLLAWRRGKDSKRPICEGFCKFFGTDKCPKREQLPKHGHCELFRINATTPQEAQRLLAADAKKFKVILAKFHGALMDDREHA